MRVHVCLHMDKYLHMYICVYLYTYILVYVYVHIHLYVFTYVAILKVICPAFGLYARTMMIFGAFGTS